jgi:hypothetical protein
MPGGSRERRAFVWMEAIAQVDDAFDKAVDGLR